MWVIAAVHLDSARALCVGHCLANLVECFYFTSLCRLAVLAGLCNPALQVLCSRERFGIRWEDEGRRKTRRRSAELCWEHEDSGIMWSTWMKAGLSVLIFGAFISLLGTTVPPWSLLRDPQGRVGETALLSPVKFNSTHTGLGPQIS